jgi:hypothetical protein
MGADCSAHMFYSRVVSAGVMMLALAQLSPSHYYSQSGGAVSQSKQRMTSSTAHEPIVLNADPEHAGLRVTVLAVLAIALAAGFFALRSLLREAAPGLTAPSILACGGSIPLALALGAGVEAILKRTWTSGKRLLLEHEKLSLQWPDERDVVLELGQTVNETWWHFPLAGYRRGGRERRVSDRWHCVAGQLQQEGSRIIAFTFVPPQRMEAWQALRSFYRLQPSEVYDNSLQSRLEGPVRPEIPTAVIAGESGRYWLAERHRWQQGIELTPEDFETLLGILQERSWR